eukprot:TRINITY_DN7543_c0_g1_i1.p1 TRINITY_DN7543_c0_g1~~TRINITY_DN7543_c0_g1_i1.p1  ORF type:complete len:487 (+),score=106.59 TRINITY_DN7543_c0_g1_i1:394-1854(+)
MLGRVLNRSKKCKIYANRNTLQNRYSHLNIRNPATGELLKKVATTTTSQVQDHYNNAKLGFDYLSAIPMEKRIEFMQNVKTAIEQNANELGIILTAEMGKPLDQSIGEIKACIERIDYFCEHVPQHISDTIQNETASMTESLTHEPLGVIGNISAWNYPYFVGFNVLVPALLTGNSVLYKSSEYCVETGEAIVKLFHDAGFPVESITSIVGGGDVGKSMTELPLDGLFFTGSYATGRKISESYRKNNMFGKLQLELGGKDPHYVHDDVDIAHVANELAGGSFYNNGQSCCSVERIYVHEKVHDQFVEEFVNVVKSYKMGDPMEEGIFLGPLARPQHVSFLKEQVADALDKGANMLTGGQEPSTNTENCAYYPPTVFTNVNHTMSLMKDETFGPLIGIQKVTNPEEAINLMNDTEYGLTSGVWSKDQSLATSMLHKIASGTVYWNCCDRVSSQLPWSGRNNSGVGATLGEDGIRAFTVPKAWHKRLP